jgi:hypothetical protein
MRVLPERNESGRVEISAHVGWSDGGSFSHLVKGRHTVHTPAVFNADEWRGTAPIID